MPQGKVVLITGGYDHTIRFWEVQSGSCYRTLQYPDSPINLLRVSPDKRWLAVCGNPHCRLYSNDQATSTHTHQFDGHSTNITGVVFSPDGTAMYTSSEDSTVKGWDMRTNQSTVQLSCSQSVNAVAMRPSGWVLVSGDQGGHVRVWDLRKTNHCMREMMPEGDSAIRSVAFAPDDSVLVAANNAGSFYVWKVSEAPRVEDRAEQRPAFQARPPAAEGQRAARPNGAAQSQSAVNGQAGDRGTGTGVSESDEDWEGSEEAGDGAAADDEHDDEEEEEQEDETEEEDASASEEVPAGRGGGGGGGGGDVTLEEVPKMVQAHSSYILRCQISPDSKLLATTSADQTVKLWSVGNYDLVQTLHGHQRWVWDLDFSADSQFLVTGSSDNTARSWNVSQVPPEIKRTDSKLLVHRVRGLCAIGFDFAVHVKVPRVADALVRR